jgi:hypothetical protein
MLAEKFFLVLETLLSRTNPDGGPRVESTSRQVPIKLHAEAASSLRADGLSLGGLLRLDGEADAHFS